MRLHIVIPPTRNNEAITRDLLYGCWCSGRRIAKTLLPPVPEALVATYLSMDQHQVSLFDLRVQNPPERAILDADFIIFNTSSFSFHSDVKYFSRLKIANPRLKVICYGAHPTFRPQEALFEPSIDYIIAGEPEESLIQFFRSYPEVDGIPGVGIRGNGYTTSGLASPPELDALPFPDRERFIRGNRRAYLYPLARTSRYTTAFTSRGCNGTCTFCSSPSFFGRTQRFRTAENVLEELMVLKVQGYKEVLFRDESFTANRARTLSLCESMMEEEVSLKWACNSRVDHIDPELAEAMKKAGCYMIKFGVETGTQEGLDRIGKSITLDEIKRAFQICDSVNIATHAHFMLGVPGETKNSITRTIGFACSLGATTATFNIFTPFPGTPFYEEKIHESVNNKSFLYNPERIHSIQQPESETYLGEAMDLSSYLTRAYRQFYFRSSPIQRIWNNLSVHPINAARSLIQIMRI